MLVTKLWRELCTNCDLHGHALRLSYNLPVLYLYCNSFFMHDIHGEFGLINVHLFDIWPAISYKNVRDFFSLKFILQQCVTALAGVQSDRTGDKVCDCSPLK